MLEYKYITLFLTGAIDRRPWSSARDGHTSVRQATDDMVPGMERRGFTIHWLPWDMPDDEFVGAVGAILLTSMRHLYALTLSLLRRPRTLQRRASRADSLELYEVRKAVEELIYRVGVCARPKGADLRLTMLWNYVDSTRQRRAEFGIPAAAHDDGITSRAFLWRIVERRNGVDSSFWRKATTPSATPPAHSRFPHGLLGRSASACRIDNPCRRHSVAFDRDSTALTRALSPHAT